MKKILGLYLGVAAIGWAYVSQTGEKERGLEVLGMGLKKIPLPPDSIEAYFRGTPPIRPARMLASGHYPGYFKLRFRGLRTELESIEGVPSGIRPAGLDKKHLLALLDKAKASRIPILEFASLLLDVSADKGLPLSEFDQIWECQQRHYPKSLTESRRNSIRSLFRYRQKKMQARSRQPQRCPLEKGRRVGPKSSPLVQAAEIWQALNLVTYRDKENDIRHLTAGQKEDLFRILDRGEKLNWRTACEAIGLNYLENLPDKWTKAYGFPTNETTRTLKKAFAKLGIERDDLLESDYDYHARKHLASGKDQLELSHDPGSQPLHRLWALLYDSENASDLQRELKKEFRFHSAEAEIIGKIDFRSQGFASKSIQAYRRLLPYLMAGHAYANACLECGYDSGNIVESSVDAFSPAAIAHVAIEKPDPVASSVLQQLTLLLGDLIRDQRFGMPDRIHVEVARELTQGHRQRGRAFMRKKENKRDQLATAAILEGMGFRSSRKNIEKHKLFHSTDGISPYSGAPISLTGFLSSETADIDHIVPQSRLFDDTFQNKVIAEYAHNRKKGDSTAADYMQSLGDETFTAFKERIIQWHKSGKITVKKRNYFFMSEEEIPDDLIDKDMQLENTFVRAARQILEKSCPDTSGSSSRVTALLRRIWGWEEVLKLLNLNTYQDAGQTYDRIHPDGTAETRIMDIHWEYNKDVRHHALDALVVACTRPYFLQRLNYLNGEQGTSMRGLEAEFAHEKPFDADAVMAIILKT